MTGYLNMSDCDIEAKVRALHENLDHALSCLSGLQQPLPCTSRVTAAEEAAAHEQLEREMCEALELICSAFYDCDEISFQNPNNPTKLRNS